MQNNTGTEHQAPSPAIALGRQPLKQRLTRVTAHTSGSTTPLMEVRQFLQRRCCQPDGLAGAGESVALGRTPRPAVNLLQHKARSARTTTGCIHAHRQQCFGGDTRTPRTSCRPARRAEYYCGHPLPPASAPPAEANHCSSRWHSNLV